MAKTWTLLGADGIPYQSAVPGALGGHRKLKIYGLLNCASAKRFLDRGHYVNERVFFLNEEVAKAAGFRPCAKCMKREYAEWKASKSK
jgi:methylphosphotriester-DNA--protein-cysteine methyltransferase